MYPEFSVPEDQKRPGSPTARAPSSARRPPSATAGRSATAFPIQATFWRKKDGSRIWEFNVARHLRRRTRASTPRSSSSTTTTSTRRGSHRPGHRRLVRRADRRSRRSRRRSGKAIDALFANSPDETKTVTEKALAQGFADQIGNIGAIIQLDPRRGLLHPAAGRRQHHGAVGARAHQRAGGAEDARLHQRRDAGPGARRVVPARRPRRRPRAGARRRSPSRAAIRPAASCRSSTSRRRTWSWGSPSWSCWAWSPASCRPCQAMRLRIVDALRRV